MIASGNLDCKNHITDTYYHSPKILNYYFLISTFKVVYPRSRPNKSLPTEGKKQKERE